MKTDTLRRNQQIKSFFFKIRLMLILNKKKYIFQIKLQGLEAIQTLSKKKEEDEEKNKRKNKYWPKSNSKSNQCKRLE